MTRTRTILLAAGVPGMLMSTVAAVSNCCRRRAGRHQRYVLHPPVMVLAALACGVQAGCEPHRMRLLEYGRHKVRLQQRLASTARDAATLWLQVGRYAADLRCNLLAADHLTTCSSKENK